MKAGCDAGKQKRDESSLTGTISPRLYHCGFLGVLTVYFPDASLPEGRYLVASRWCGNPIRPRAGRFSPSLSEDGDDPL